MAHLKRYFSMWRAARDNLERLAPDLRRAVEQGDRGADEVAYDWLVERGFAKLFDRLDDIITLDELAEYFRLPSSDEIMALNEQWIAEQRPLAMETRDPAEEYDEEADIAAETAAQNQLYRAWADAVENAALEVFGNQGLMILHAEDGYFKRERQQLKDAYPGYDGVNWPYEYWRLSPGGWGWCSTAKQLGLERQGKEDCKTLVLSEWRESLRWFPREVRRRFDRSFDLVNQ